MNAAVRILPIFESGITEQQKARSAREFFHQVALLLPRVVGGSETIFAFELLKLQYKSLFQHFPIRRRECVPSDQLDAVVSRVV